jgi:hypothetical protein
MFDDKEEPVDVLKEKRQPLQHIPFCATPIDFSIEVGQ